MVGVKRCRSVLNAFRGAALCEVVPLTLRVDQNGKCSRDPNRWIRCGHNNRDDSDLLFNLRRHKPGGTERQRENFHKNVVGTRMYCGDMLTETGWCRLTG